MDFWRVLLLRSRCDFDKRNPVGNNLCRRGFHGTELCGKSLPANGLGQIIGSFFDASKIAVYNAAIGGYLFIQFGHNDRYFGSKEREVPFDSLEYWRSKSLHFFPVSSSITSVKIMALASTKPSLSVRYAVLASTASS